MPTSTLIRRARLVPVRTKVAPDSPVDIRIRDGVVTEVGADLRPGPDDDVLDAAGRWAVPGLWDAHVHLTAWAQARAKLDVSGTSSTVEVTRIVADHVASLPSPWQGGAIVGYGFRPATWPTAPTVAELDAVSGAHPVILGSADIHTGWVNSKALALLGVAPRSGPLLEGEWFDLQPAVARLTAAGGDADLMLRAAVADAAAVGVVGVVDFEMAANHLDWPRRFDAGIDLLRVRPVTYAEHLDDAIAAGLRTGTEFSAGGGLLTQGSLKIFSDGSLNTRTAYCCEPYADAHALESPRGQRVYSLAELENLLTRGRRGGFDIALHAIGDAAVDQALTAFESTGTRGSIEHAQLIRLEDVARMRALGVRASVQPGHLLDDRDVTNQCWPDRADRCFALRSMLDGGVELALGSDAPVSPLDPWGAMAAAVHRATGDDAPWNPDESLTAAQALAASTDGQGTIGVGSRGDVVLVDEDPLRSTGSTADTAHLLRNIGVAATVVAGRVTHLAM
ncbi:amidohydrolase family protein [Williamsia sp. 1138]|uniref:amidohydrolase n=1 Tax=Williamsia sp. 1138 TaxID=1903117 RepID=UPI000A10F5F0|nr:amidohydrolase family protein [Williamsia sp. 1138]